MAAPIKNNLPPASQQWVRDIERRIADLERDNALLQVMANTNSTQLSSTQEAVRFSRTGALSASLARTVTGSGDDYQTARIPVPSWARSATIMLTVGSYAVPHSPPKTSGMVAADVIVAEMNPGGTNVILETPSIYTEVSSSDDSLQMNFNRFIVTPVREGSTEVQFVSTFGYNFVAPGGVTFYMDALAIFSASEILEND